MLVLTIASGFNWDRIIAKYNFDNAAHSFVHLNFLATLSDSALPYLDKSVDELSKIRVGQERKFSFDLGLSSSSMNLFSRAYMKPDEYYIIMNQRKQLFKRKWEAKGFLEWNLAEYKTYNELFTNK